MRQAYFIGGKVPVALDDNRCGFVTKDGDILKCPKEVRGTGYRNKDYYMYVGDSGEYWGVMKFDSDGDEVVIKAKKYKYLIPLNASMSKFIACVDEGDYRIIDRDDETLVKLEYKDIDVVPGCFTILAKDGESWYIIDEEGKVKDKKQEIKEYDYYVPRTVRSDLQKLKDEADYDY